MAKKQYEEPMMEIICQLQQNLLLAGSGVTATISDFEEEEWIPNPSANILDFPDPTVFSNNFILDQN